MTATKLYDLDFFEWTQCNAALLRAGRFDEADIEHIAEEIRDMGAREQHELESRLEVLLQHLLKWQFQPHLRGRSWRSTIKVQRRDIAKLLRRMPSLKPKLAAGLDDAYEGGVVLAWGETDLPEDSFPASCPFTLEQILDKEYFPE